MGKNPEYLELRIEKLKQIKNNVYTKWLTLLDINIEPLCC